MTVIARWWCCAEYARTGAQHDEACEYALLGDRADVLVQVKADYALLAHQLRGAVETLALVRTVLEGVAPHDDKPSTMSRVGEALTLLRNAGDSKR